MLILWYELSVYQKRATSNPWPVFRRPWLNPNGHEGRYFSVFTPCPFWIRFSQLNFYLKFPYFTFSSYAQPIWIPYFVNYFFVYILFEYFYHILPGKDFFIFLNTICYIDIFWVFWSWLQTQKGSKKKLVVKIWDLYWLFVCAERYFLDMKIDRVNLTPFWPLGGAKDEHFSCFHSSC